MSKRKTENVAERPIPTATRQQLGRLLQELRNRAGYSPPAVVREPYISMSRAKLYLMEAGEVPIKAQDVLALCRVYRTDDDVLQKALTLAEGTHGPAWWREYGPDAAPEWFKLTLDLEQIAHKISAYQPEAVPGLLQTRDYAEAVLRCMNPTLSKGEISSRASLRLDRQAILKKARAPKLHVVLAEAVLRCRVGGEDVMTGQIAHLTRMSRRLNIRVGVLPFMAGYHPAMGGAFSIMEFPDEKDPMVVYLEHRDSAMYRSDPAEAKHYSGLLRRALAQTIPLEDVTL